MNISLLKRGGLSKLSLLAIPLVSLLGVTSVSAATPAPEPVDGKIVLEQGVEYDGFTIPANTTVEGNGATVVGKVTVDGDNVTIDHVNFSGDGGSAITAGQVAKNLTISNNIFTGYSGPTITLGGGDYSGLSIIKNRDDNINANNIQVVLNTAVDDIEISGNTFGSVVRIEGFADSLTTGIKITGNIFDKVPTTAISVVKADGALIDRNIITTADTNTGSAIVAGGQVTNTTYSNNEITAPNVTANTAISISQIDYKNNAGEIIKVGKSDSVSIVGNTVKNFLFGVLLQNTDEATLNSNTIDAIKKCGILIGAGSDTPDMGNVVITMDNTITSADMAVLVKGNGSSMMDGAKVRISSAAKITGSIAPKDTEYVEFYAEPTTEEPTDQPTTGDQTAPDVTAPNTGAHRLSSTPVSAIALVTFIVASVATLSYVAKSFKK